MSMVTLKGFFKKARIFKNLLKHIPLRDAKRRLFNPAVITRHIKALFGYNLASAPSLLTNKYINKNQNQPVIIFSDFEELHERITGDKEGFKRNTDMIRNLAHKGEKVHLKISLSRYNFSRLNRMVDFSFELLGKKNQFPPVSFKVFPVKDIAVNFKNYVEEIRKQVGPEGIIVTIDDNELMEILNTVALHAQANEDREKDLLRLLGIISEQVFIGPQTIVFDPFHRCNAKCQHCWVHTPQVKHPEEFLNRKFDFEIFKEVVNDASSMMTDGIILQGDGEPLMYENFMPMLRYARNKGLGVLFFTNGILFDEEKAREVIELGVNEIYCSFPAGTADVYEKISAIQPPETFYKIKNNLKRFMELKKESASDRPRLIVTHVIHTMNCHQLIDMAEMDAEISPDAVRFYLIRLDVMNKFLQLKPEEVRAIKEQIPAIKGIFKRKNIDFVDNFEFQLENYDEKTGAWSKDFFLKHGCTIGWYFNLIPAKYDMSFCCHLRTVGHVNACSFKDIWNSIEYWRWRRQAKYLKENANIRFLNGQILYDEHCDHCDNHQTIIKSLDELKKYDLYKYYK
ncbi:MAG: radical SAM protein [Candidatus Omnitrophica bacterium]|nr:radical SAM protein [Candidatus Omnitrophota bacterium]